MEIVTISGQVRQFRTLRELILEIAMSDIFSQDFIKTYELSISLSLVFSLFSATATVF